MENLVPREAYDIDEGGYRQRLRLVTSLFSSLMIGIACLFLMSPAIGFGWRALLGACAGVFCVIVFVKSFRLRFRRRMSSMIDRLYAGDTEIDTPPPPEKDLRYRLPCSWKRGEYVAVGGVLYLGPQGLLFVPHKMNLPRDRSCFEMGPSKSLKFSLTSPQSTRFRRMLVSRPPTQLQVIWSDGSAQFLVPAPSRVLDLIEERVREMA